MGAVEALGAQAAIGTGEQPGLAPALGSEPGLRQVQQGAAEAAALVVRVDKQGEEAAVLGIGALRG